MFTRKEIMIFVMAFMIGLSLAWSCRLEAADNATKENIYPNFLLYNSTSSCVRGIANIAISINPNLARQPVPPGVIQQMVGHCSCIMDRIRTEVTFAEYSKNMSNYIWVREIWAKHGKFCFEEGYLNGTGIQPEPEPDPASKEEEGIPLEIPDFAKGVLPHLS